MCNECGCSTTSISNQQPGASTRSEEAGEHHSAVEVLERLLSANDRQAAHNREHFDRHRVVAINLMSSPGSGKTLLLEKTIEALTGELRIGVIEGDLETENDAQRIRAKGAPAIQITTGTACHLDAHMVHNALHRFDLSAIDLLFIENVGNLVCPASFDLGQHYNLTLLSVTEGDDKPAKYPVIFRCADRVVITKQDLLPYMDEFKPERVESSIRALANSAPVQLVSAKSGDGMQEWLAWLRVTAETRQGGGDRHQYRRAWANSLRP